MPEPKRFRKKAVEVEAVQWTGENVDEVVAFADLQGEVRAGDSGCLYDGFEEVAQKGDYFVLDRSQGDLAVPMRPAVFETTYEPASASLQKDGGEGQLDKVRTEYLRLSRVEISELHDFLMAREIPKLMEGTVSALGEALGYMPDLSPNRVACKECGRSARDGKPIHRPECSSSPQAVAPCEQCGGEGWIVTKLFPRQTELCPTCKAASTQPASPSEEVERVTRTDPLIGVYVEVELAALKQLRAALDHGVKVIEANPAYVRSGLEELLAGPLLTRVAALSESEPGRVPACPSPVEANGDFPDEVFVGQETVGGRVSERFLLRPQEAAERQGDDFVQVRRYVPATSDQEAGEVEGCPACGSTERTKVVGPCAENNAEAAPWHRNGGAL